MKHVASVLFLLFCSAMSAGANTYVVNNTIDPGNGTCEQPDGCTLREAIDEANANPGADVINFNIPGSGVHTITPASALPELTDPVTIDGYTQPEASANTLAVGDDAVLLIEIDGTNESSGLSIATSECTIRGLVINRCGSSGILVLGDGALIEGTFIGTNAEGTAGLGNGLNGINVLGASNTVIGGSTPASRNLISGNGSDGVSIFVNGPEFSTGNVVEGNYIGTDASGMGDQGNGGSGVELGGFTSANFIGGAAPGAGNLISGNQGGGIAVLGLGNNFVQGNLIGTDATGGAVLGNDGDGIFVEDNPNNTIGGAVTGARNIISGNVGFGVHLTGMAASGNRVEGNYIGTDASGSVDLGNSSNGVYIVDAPANTIGGTTAGAGNILSGNVHGVEINGQAASGNHVEGNYIGTDVLGTSVFGNSGNGVFLTGAPGNIIGGAAAGAGNVISGNSFGVAMLGSSAIANQVLGNRIGTDPTGALPLPNESGGISLVDSADTIIGGPNGAGNTIAFNSGDAVRIEPDVTQPAGNNIFANSIFSNGGLGINLTGGVEDANGVTANDVGDADPGPNNLQNYPVINEIAVAGARRTVEGQLNSAANTDYTVDFYCNSEIDPSGFGEGETYLGSLDVQTNALGEVFFSFPLAASVAGKFITATATDPNGNTSEFSMASEAVPAVGRFLNVSTRLRVQTGDNVLIGGFIITGSAPSDVLLRAIGPSLKVDGTPLPGRLANPTLELFQGSTLLASNDDWKDSQKAEIEATGIPPAHDLESAIVRTLDPGAYTAIVRGANDGTGIGLVEAYDLSAIDAERFANISTRGFVETGDNVMIGGFIVDSNAGMMIRVVVRAIGPSLTDLGVAGALQDPRLELFDANGVMIQANDNWKDTQQAEIEAAGLALTDDRESAIVRDLAPGAYTAITRGVGDTTGVGLVEAYDIQ